MIGDGPVDDHFDYTDVLEVREQPTVCACGVLRAECLLPRGDSSVALCWVCAHDYTEHGAEPGERAEHCDCSDHDVLPPGVTSLTVADLRSRIAFFKREAARIKTRRWWQ